MVNPLSKSHFPLMSLPGDESVVFTANMDGCALMGLYCIDITTNSWVKKLLPKIMMDPYVDGRKCDAGRSPPVRDGIFIAPTCVVASIAANEAVPAVDGAYGYCSRGHSWKQIHQVLRAESDDVERRQ